MARNVQLIQMVASLRDELGLSNSVAVGVDDVPSLKRSLRRVQEGLYDEYDWPHLRIFTAKIALSAGQRYYDVPADLNYERIERAVTWWGDIPKTIDRGIGFHEYASYDSERDERSDPALRWDIRWTGTVEQIEVWPIPASSDYSLQWRGIRKLRPLLLDTDVCDIDERLIVLFAAAEHLERSKAGDAASKRAQAQALLSRLKGRSTAGGGRIRLGLGQGTGARHSFDVKGGVGGFTLDSSELG